MIDEQYKNEARELLEPIVDLFSGADGGAAFVKLRHGLLPDMLSKRPPNPNWDSNIVEMTKSIENLSKLCSALLEKS